MRTFNLLFKLPEKEEFVVAAWAAISEYTRRLREASFPVHTTIISKETWLTNLLIPPMIFMVESMEEVERQHFDLVADLSEDRAISLGQTGRTAASAYGLIIGMEQVPELVKIKSPEVKNDLLFLYWDESIYKSLDSRLRKLGINYRTIEAKHLMDSEWIHDADGSVSWYLPEVLKSKIILGPRSIWTYLAASAGRVVLEGYITDAYPREFFSKWSNRNYHMLCASSQESLNKNIEIIWQSLERLIKTHIPQQEEVNAISE
jgi:hypothetical protein